MLTDYDYINLPLEQATMNSLVLNPFILSVVDNMKVSKTNLMVVSYVGVASEKPPIMTLAIRPSRYSHQLLLEQKKFVLNFPSQPLMPVIDYCGTFSGRKKDKVEELALEIIDFNGYKLIASAPLALCCNLKSRINLSEMEKATHDLFLAEVVYCLTKKDFKIEEYPCLVTANYAYRSVRGELGRAHATWHQEIKGG